MSINPPNKSQAKFGEESEENPQNPYTAIWNRFDMVVSQIENTKMDMD